MVALTFDDGPDRIFSPRILELLDKENVKATFFLVGRQIKENPMFVSQLIAGGHQVAGHGWSHTNLRLKESNEVKEEIEKTSAAIKNVTGLEPLFIRPPYGELSDDAMKEIINLDYTAVNWSVDSLDWYSRSVDDILTSTLKDTKRGSIILMHSTGGNLDATVKALPELLNTLKAQGYSFVTVSELLDKKSYRQ